MENFRYLGCSDQRHSFIEAKAFHIFENLKGFEQLCFGLHTCFTGVKRECGVWENLFLTILNPFTSLAFKHILPFNLKNMFHKKRFDEC